jgi:hypothetical protein
VDLPDKNARLMYLRIQEERLTGQFVDMVMTPSTPDCELDPIRAELITIKLEIFDLLNPHLGR